LESMQFKLGSTIHSNLRRGYLMITIRGLLLFGFLALLSGCVTNPCSDPDEISQKWVPQCLYYLKVTHTDPSNSTVKAQYALNYSKKPIQTFSFRVRDLEHLKIEKGQEYYFIRQGSSPFLEPYYETPRGIFQHEPPEGKQDSSKAGK